MNTYTYIMYFKGGTYISQIKANSLEDSMKIWSSELDIVPIKYFGIKAKRELINQIYEEVPSLLDGLINIWYLSFLLNGHYTVVHVVKTDNLSS